MCCKRLLITGCAVACLCSASLSSTKIDAIVKKGVFPGEPVNLETQKAKGDYILMGTFIANGKKSAVIFIKRKRDFVTVREGDKLDNFKVESISKGKVILTVGGKKLILSTFSEDAELARKYVKSRWHVPDAPAGTIQAKAPAVNKAGNTKVSPKQPGGTKGNSTSKLTKGKQPVSTNKPTNNKPKRKKPKSLFEVLKSMKTHPTRHNSTNPNNNPFLKIIQELQKRKQRTP